MLSNVIVVAVLLVLMVLYVARRRSRLNREAAER